MPQCGIREETSIAIKRLGESTKMRNKILVLVFFALQLFPLNLFAEDLTADYLVGPWCFSHTVSGSEQSDENKNFLFKNDGTFSYQQSSHNKKLTPGFKYEIMPGKLKLKPIFPGELQVKSVKDHELVLKYFVDIHLIRGKCN